MFGTLDVYEQPGYNRETLLMVRLEQMKKNETKKVSKFNLVAIYILTIVALMTNIAYATDYYVSNKSC